MSKVDIDIVKMVLQREAIESRKLAQIIEDIKVEEQAARDELSAEKEPATKKQYAFILSDPYGEIKALGKDFTGWVVQIPEDDAPQTATDKIIQGAYDFNASPKGARLPLKTFAEAFENGSAKLYKEQKVFVKTKEPILLIPVGRDLPREDGE